MCADFLSLTHTQNSSGLVNLVVVVLAVQQLIILNTDVSIAQLAGVGKPHIALCLQVPTSLCSTQPC